MKTKKNIKGVYDPKKRKKSLVSDHD
jgi:hypothetical protein